MDDAMSIHLYPNNLPDDLTLGPVVAIDTETTSLDEMQADLVGISLAVAPGRACYIPLGHVRGATICSASPRGWRGSWIPPPSWPR